MWTSQRPLLFIMKVNDLPSTKKYLTNTNIFTDKTSIIISSKHFDDLCILSNTALSCLSNCFTANKLVLNINKTNIITFITNTSPQYSLNRGYNDRVSKYKIPDLLIGNHLNWKKSC
jgi:hypothetical protein